MHPSLITIWILLSIVLVLSILFMFILEIERCRSYIVRPDTRLDFSDNHAFDVDFVITWVDSSNEEWQRERLYWNRKIFGNVDIKKNRYPTTDYSCRELKTAVHSVIRYLPWIRNIIIVTQRPQIPKFMHEDTDGRYAHVRIVHHDEFFYDISHLPTFNSLSIEANLCGIKGLSEQFIYSNDDVYIVRHMLLRDFFDRCGKPIIGGSWNPNCFLSLLCMRLQETDNGHNMAWVNVFKQIGTAFIHTQSHTCVPMTNTLLSSVRQSSLELFESTSTNKFRHQPNAVQVPSIGLALNHGILSRAVVKHADSTMNVTMNTLSDIYATMCLNEETDHRRLDDIDNILLSPSPVRTIDYGGAVLMLVAHCDDEIIFGAPALLLATNDIYIAVLTQQPAHRRLETQNMIGKLCMDKGRIHWLELDCDLMADSRLRLPQKHTLQSMVDCIIKAMQPLSVNVIISHGSDGEYGHLNHRVVHQLASKISLQTSIPFKNFADLWNIDIGTVEKLLFQRQRHRLLRNYVSQSYGKRYENFFSLR